MASLDQRPRGLPKPDRVAAGPRGTDDRDAPATTVTLRCYRPYLTPIMNSVIYLPFPIFSHFFY